MNAGEFSLPAPTAAVVEGLTKAAELIQRADTFLVVAHEHPDGDAIGSSLAMGHILSILGKHAVVFNVSEVPYNLRFLPGSGEMVTSLASDQAFDVTIVLDCSDATRVGTVPANLWGTSTLVIDHHRTPYEGADVTVHDPTAASVSQILLYLCAELHLDMTVDLAQCLYTALSTDTGSFRYSNATSAAFAAASAMVGCGVNVWNVTENVYESHPVERIKLLAEVLTTLKLTSCGRLATLLIEQAMFTRTDADATMLDGFINHARGIRGVEVAAQLTEDDCGTRVSFRSRGNIDVGTIAAELGGGGHRNAAGCVLALSLVDARAKLEATFSRIFSASDVEEA